MSFGASDHDTPLLSHSHRFPPSPSGSNGPARPLTQPSMATHHESSLMSRIPFLRALDHRISQCSLSDSPLVKRLGPYLNRFGRLLLVLTFLEDSIRIATQSKDQLKFLTKDARFSTWAAQSFVVLSVADMSICSLLVIFNQTPQIALLGLLVSTICQGYVYGLMTDLTFICLSLSIMGGLMLNVSNHMIQTQQAQRASERRSLSLNAPSPPEIDNRFQAKLKTLQFMGRICLVTFFVGHTIFMYLELVEKVSIGIGLIGVLSIGASLLVAIGYKAKYSTMFLVVVSSVVNVLVNDWWSTPKDHPEREFRKYDFFQAMSIVGGMILLINQGPGGISLDEKRKSV